MIKLYILAYNICMCVIYYRIYILLGIKIMYFYVYVCDPDLGIIVIGKLISKVQTVL